MNHTRGTFNQCLLNREGITPPSLLVAGHANGVVKLFMNGFLLCAVINLAGEDAAIHNVQGR